MSFRVLSHIKRSIFVRSRWGCLRKRCANKKLLRLPIFPIFLSLVRLYTYYIYYYHTTTYLLILNACILFLLYFLFSHLFSSFVVFEKNKPKRRCSVHLCSTYSFFKISCRPVDKYGYEEDRDNFTYPISIFLVVISSESDVLPFFIDTTTYF